MRRRLRVAVGVLCLLVALGAAALFIVTTWYQIEYAYCLNGSYRVIYVARGGIAYALNQSAQWAYRSALDEYPRWAAAKADYDARWPEIEKLRTRKPEVWAALSTLRAEVEAQLEGVDSAEAYARRAAARECRYNCFSYLHPPNVLRDFVWLPVVYAPPLEFSLPLWAPFVAALAGAACLLWPRRRPRPGFCAGCGYNLAGNVSGRCPECGRDASRV